MVQQRSPRANGHSAADFGAHLAARDIKAAMNALLS
jgi:hypothetical protein